MQVFSRKSPSRLFIESPKEKDDRLLGSAVLSSDAPVDFDRITSPASPVKKELESLVAVQTALGAEASTLTTEIRKLRVETGQFQAQLVAADAPGGEPLHAPMPPKLGTPEEHSPSSQSDQEATSISPQSSPSFSSLQWPPLSPLEPRADAESPSMPPQARTPPGQPQSHVKLEIKIGEDGGDAIVALRNEIEALQAQLQRAGDDLAVIESRRAAEALTAQAESDHLQRIVRSLQSEVERIGGERDLREQDLAANRAAAGKAIIRADKARAAQAAVAKVAQGRVVALDKMVEEVKAEVQAAMELVHKHQAAFEEVRMENASLKATLSAVQGHEFGGSLSSRPSLASLARPKDSQLSTAIGVYGTAASEVSNTKGDADGNEASSRPRFLTANDEENEESCPVQPSTIPAVHGKKVGTLSVVGPWILRRMPLHAEMERRRSELVLIKNSSKNLSLDKKEPNALPPKGHRAARWIRTVAVVSAAVALLRWGGTVGGPAPRPFVSNTEKKNIKIPDTALI